MTKEITMYTIICDRCGKDAAEGHLHDSCWRSPHEARVGACVLTVNGKDYCRACTYLDKQSEMVLSKTFDAAKQSIAVDANSNLRTMVLTEKEQEDLDVSHAQEWLQTMWETTKDNRLMCACMEDVAWTLAQYRAHLQGK